MRSILAAAVLMLVACGGNNNGDDGDDTNMKPDACVGLECQVVNCGAMQKQPTTITGTVFAPNGTLPLFGINVYVPRDPPAAFTEGAQCSRCSDELPGSPIARTQSDDAGKFTLENVPAGDNIPLVITSGKWRRQIVIPHVDSCTMTAVGAAETRLPKNKSEGDIPKIALTTGGADSLECLLRKLGIDDSELTNASGTGRVNFYVGGATGNDTRGVGSSTTGGAFTEAQTLWNSLDKLKSYDIVFLSCEGDQNPEQKTQTAMNYMTGYADIGGRVFASHWHNVWIGGEFQSRGPDGPEDWMPVATWGRDGNPGSPIIIDEASNGKGPAFASWMLNVKGSTVRDQIVLQRGTGRATSTDAPGAEKWVNSGPQTGSSPQMFQFTTPNKVASDQRCGKVVFTDMHVSGTSQVNNPFPDSCPGGAGNTSLTPQEKALAFMFFDIASCVGGIF